MDKSYAYVALLDVLGYRKFLEQDRQAGTLDFKDRLQAAMAVLAQVNEGEYPYQAISDTIIITCADRSSFIEFCGVVKTVYIAFLKQGLLVRGGISYAQHFKSGSITYSHAVAASYALESANAIVPRVMIADDVIDLQSSLDVDVTPAGLIASQNGAFYLDVIDQENCAEFYILAKTLYGREQTSLIGNESGFMKHLWLEYYVTTHRFAKSSQRKRYIKVAAPVETKSDGNRDAGS